jgi:hypothetical protein
MHTLFDFVTKVNGAQFLLSLLFILGFIVLAELFKTRPFAGVRERAADDVRFLKAQGNADRKQLFKNMAMAPVYFLRYLVSVPVLFVQGMAEPLGRGVATAGWSPVRAYFAGRKNMKAKGNDQKKQPSK